MFSVSTSERVESTHGEVQHCHICHDAGLLHQHRDGRRAKPLFHIEGSKTSHVLFIFEAPNFDDTYNPSKGTLTCDPDTDPSGRFFFDLLQHVGLAPSDVLITNSVLCLPATKNGKYPVSAAQRRACSPWLRRLIAEMAPRVVAPCGGQALKALKLISPHTFKLSTDAGRLHEWHSRLILPLYHPGALGRISRPAAMQFKDIEALKAVLT